MSKIVVSDTTALIHLSRIRALHVLKDLYTEILIPQAVYDEVVRKGPGRPGAIEVANASWIKVEKVQNPAVIQRMNAQLGLGESEAIALALEKGADVLIIDEVAGRAEAAGLGLGQQIIGMVGVLLAAKKAGFITEIRSFLDALTNNGFHLSPKLRELALERAGEAGQAQKS